MSVLNRKVWRDLWAMKGQALAIALVMASGVTTFVMYLSTLDSLQLTQETFYREGRFAEVFAPLKRAPESLKSRIAEIPGVQLVETRVIAAVNLDIPGFSDPAAGRLISIPDHGPPVLNGLYMRRGRTVDPGRDDEIVVGEAFAKAHEFEPGDRIGAIINGRRKNLRIVGVALSPEYVYQIQPGEMIPDFESFGVMWMARTPLATAYDMDGAFNDVALTLTPDARLQEVLDRLDDRLEDYGGLGAYARADQLSHRYLSEEFRMLEEMATLFPVMFLGVAAFLLNVVVVRLVNTQKEEVATLKAFGYGNLVIAAHYLKMVGVIVLVGLSVGLILGRRLGIGMTQLYVEFYRFPFLKYELHPGIALLAALFCAAAALMGTLYSVRRAALRPPAEAMRPEPPARYRESVVERLGLKGWFSQPTRMIVRNIERRPIQSLLSVIGIALALAILMVGTSFEDAINFMVRVQFGFSQREDLSLTFVEPTSERVLYDLDSLLGVDYGEGFRAVPVRLRSRHRHYLTQIQGVEAGGDLYRLMDTGLNVVQIPPSGVLLTDHLAGILGVGVGDLVTVEVLEGNRPRREVPVTGLVSQYVGVSGYMERRALNRLMREGRSISGAFLAVDSRYQNRVYQALREMPQVAGTAVRTKAVRNFYETMGEFLLTFAFFATLFASTIAVGVVYNTARIALAERGRDLASLRVLGFTRGEISYILLGELAMLTLAAVPVGAVLGYALCLYIVAQMETDLFRMPLVIEPGTYAFASLVILAASILSGLIVRRRLDHLDLVAVLKTKE